VNVADVEDASYEIVPVTAPEGPTSRNVAVVSVVASIGFENVARGAVDGPTSDVPGNGRATTVGG
jgi:hypothetical protein